MKIELASSYGFCYGVKRAIEIAEEHKNSFT
ncbi:MAG TPA: 4-hydroxy-3-methylbut-2-enyl diphosphate reductase, partial [Campylobacterales bacterium]|nr:4-hydroxy-3-methylbut-2-enyl diphosphate reductase [Campylobacterales bacterium]